MSIDHSREEPAAPFRNAPKMLVPDSLGPETERRRSMALRVSLDSNPSANFLIVRDMRAMAAQAFGDLASPPGEGDLSAMKQAHQWLLRVSTLLEIAAVMSGILGVVMFFFWMSKEVDLINSGNISFGMTSYRADFATWISAILGAPLALMIAAFLVVRSYRRRIDAVDALVSKGTMAIAVSRDVITIVQGEAPRRIDSSMCANADVGRMMSGHLSIEIELHDGRRESYDWIPFDEKLETCLRSFKERCRPLAESSKALFRGIATA